jgi:hypothetical protein
MRKEIMVMEWYVLNYNFNTKRIENFNIFRNIRFTEFLPQYVNGYEQGTLTYDQLKEAIRRELMSAFWSRREYEILVGDAFETNLNNYEKIDVYRQVLPNLETLVKYILDNKEYLQK